MGGPSLSSPVIETCGGSAGRHSNAGGTWLLCDKEAEV